MKTLIYIAILIWLLTLPACDDADQKTTSESGKDTAINPNNILFTTPTIENSFPDFEDKIDTTNLSIHEDDWRQIEFISKNHKSSIEKEFDSISYIYNYKSHEGKEFTGFKEVHVRTLIKQPLSVPFRKVIHYLGNSDTKVAGVSITNYPGQVKNGFSFVSKGVQYYGVKDDSGNVIALCLPFAESDEDLSNSLGKISDFLKSENLFIVNWRHTKVFHENNIDELIADFESK